MSSAGEVVFMEWLSDLLSKEFFDISIKQYGLAFMAILAGFILKRLSAYLMDRLLSVTEKTRFRFDQVIVGSLSRPLGWAFALGGIYIATLVMPVPEEPVNIRHFMNAMVKSLSIFILIWAGIRLIDHACEVWLEKAAKTDTKLDDQFIPVVRNATKVFLWLVGGVLFLQNMGYSVTSLVAGMGIGGAAIALASQNTISNLFGSLVIFLDRPFQIGDWVEIGDIEGTVEEVNMRTTRIRTFANSLITLPNSKLTTTSINNWSRMKKRRIKTTLGLSYNTPPEKVEAAVNLIRDLIRNDPKIRDDFFLVNFHNFGPSSLDIFIYCFTRTTNWAQFMDDRQAFFLDIMKGFQELGVEMSFPTQTIHIESMPGEPKAMTSERPQ
jgi:MscS family membrane protein